MREPKDISYTLEKISKSSSEANVDAILVQYQQNEMTDDETNMKYVNRAVEVENKITAVGHKLDEADKKCVLVRALRSEFEIIAGVVRATSKTIQEAIGLLVIEEAEGAPREKTVEVKAENAFQSR